MFPFFCHRMSLTSGKFKYPFIPHLLRWPLSVVILCIAVLVCFLLPTLFSCFAVCWSFCQLILMAMNYAHNWSLQVYTKRKLMAGIEFILFFALT